MLRIWTLKLALVIATVTLGLAALAGPLTKRPQLRIDRVDASKPPGVRVYTTDLDSSGAPINDRKPQSYRLLVDGVPQSGASKVVQAGKLGEPLSVTLVLQVSPSFQDVLTEVVENARALVGSLPVGSRAGLIAYTDVVVQEAKPGNPADVKRAIDDLRIREEGVEVQLLDAVRDALEGLGGKLPGQRMIVVLSDGLNANLNFRDFTAVGRRAREKGIIIHTIGFAPLEPARLRTLYELSHRAGGTFREAQSAQEITGAFGALQEELSSQRVLSYQVPKFFDGKLHDFQIELPGGQASNIVPAELAKYDAPKDVEDKKHEASSPWGILIVIGITVVILTTTTVLVLRWRQPRRAAPVAGRAALPLMDDDEEDEYHDDERDEDDEREYEDDEDEDEDDEDDEDDRERPAGRRRKLMLARNPHRSIDSLFASDPQRPAPPPSQRPSFDTSPAPRAPPAGAPYPELPPGGSSPYIEAAHGGSSPYIDPARDGSSPYIEAAPGASSRYVQADGASPLVGTGGTGGTGAQNRAVSPFAPAPTAAAPNPLASPAQGPDRQPQASPSDPDDGFRLPLPDPEDFMRQHDPAAPDVVQSEPSRGGAAGPQLPDPDEFMRQHGGGSAPPSVGGPTIGPKTGEPALADLSQPVAGQQPGGTAVSAGAGAAVEFKPAGPSMVPMAPVPETGAQPGRLLNRRTMVMAVEELNSSDFTASIVPLGGSLHHTVAVHDGFTLGSDPSCDLPLRGEGVQPRHGFIKLDSRGLRIETTGDRGEQLSQPLNDGDRFYVGPQEFLFKIAARFTLTSVGAARLEVLDGMDQGHSIALQEGVAYTIGGHNSCDLVVRGGRVGARHALALRKDVSCIIADLGTEAGLRSDGHSVGRKILNPGDELTLGDVRVIYTLEDWSDSP